MVEDAKGTLPELPRVRRARFMAEYGLPEYDSDILIGEKELADYFEQVVKICKNPKASSNWIMTELLRELNQAELTITSPPISALHLGQMVHSIENGTISGKMGKTVFAEMWKTSKDPESIIKEKGLVQIIDTSAIEKIIEEVLTANAGSVAEYKAGKTKLMGFFVGQIMKASKGQANPDLVNKILIEKLNK
jgi:aspartyl-tRNA(Asn)/glutamyl-tRNA(Gln) amidotransferase subunit B